MIWSGVARIFLFLFLFFFFYFIARRLDQQFPNWASLACLFGGGGGVTGRPG